MKFVARSCLAANIYVGSLATKVSVVHAMSEFLLAATAAKSRKTYFAMIVELSWRANTSITKAKTVR